MTTISSTHISIQNNKLHQWQLSNGDIGLSYCYSDSCNNNLTPFQELVQDAVSNDSNLIFGLDFRSNNNDIPYIKYFDGMNNLINSSMQLGNVKKEFIDTLNWTAQSDQSPTYHQFFIENFLFCNNYQLGNYSMNWLVMVDTGSSCLTLPQEIYNNFIDWFNNNTNYDNMYRLPAFKFNLAIDQSSTFYLPLSDLVINQTSIEEEKGAPYVTINNTIYRLCILQGDAIKDDNNDYYSNPPSIIFGALTLQSIYFAGDYTSKSIGLSNKLSTDYIYQIDNINNKYGCNEINSCGDDQVYIHSSNKCKDFSCNKYFFTISNRDTNECEYNKSTMIGSLIFILLIIIMEIISYFCIQYSAGIIISQDRNSDKNFDIITKYVGGFFIVFIDFIIIHILKWIPNRLNDQIQPTNNNINHQEQELMNIGDIYDNHPEVPIQGRVRN